LRQFLLLVFTSFGYNTDGNVNMDKFLIKQILTGVECRQIAGLTDLAGAYRLFNGFYESSLDLVIERYASTLVFFNHTDPPESLAVLIPEIQDLVLKRFPEVDCVLVKTRRSGDPTSRRGIITHGSAPAGMILENGVGYALDLQQNQDASFYMDTRGLRDWLKYHSEDWSVLNCFAYTGSLGAAALAGGAARVMQLDLSSKFLSLAHQTYALNGFPICEADFLIGDFFRVIGRLRKEETQFDCVILDAPFFSSSSSSSINIQKDASRLVNKVRPLVKDGGYLISINNSLYLSGNEYIQTLEKLGEDGCLNLEEIISVPEYVTGYPQTIIRRPPLDPAPFNHPTKIAVLKIRKKKNRVAPV
jgi:23S rRNA (cytosine1962-C5)-methyltransferase